MHPILVWVFATVMIALTVSAGYLAYRDQFFLPRQMIAKGHNVGLPFIAHGAMWGDLLLVTPTLIAMVATYGQQWPRGANFWLIVAGAWLIDSLLHWAWVQGTIPDCLVGSGRLTPAGLAHWVYMGLALSALGLFYFETERIQPGFLLLASTLLALHLPLATHLVLSWYHPAWWPRSSWRDPATWLVNVGGWIALAWRCHALWSP